jgi:hypothetical protein
MEFGADWQRRLAPADRLGTQGTLHDHVRVQSHNATKTMVVLARVPHYLELVKKVLLEGVNVRVAAHEGAVFSNGM